MPRNGAGTASLSSAPFVFDTVISETPMNANFADIINMLTASIANDGQTPILANLPMSGYKHTVVAATSGASSRTEYASTGTMQDGVPLDAGNTGGTSTAYTATLSPAIAAYADKQCFRVKFNAACGATPTINFNSVGAKKLYKIASGTATQLAANDVQNNQITILRYDSTLDGAAGGFVVVAANAGTGLAQSGETLSLSASYRAYDIPFAAAYDSTFTKRDAVVQDYGKIVLNRSVTFTGEVATIETAPTGAALILDIEKNGSTIYSSKPQFAASSTTLTAGTLSTTTAVSGDVLTFLVTQVGSTEPGEGILFTLTANLT